MRRAIIQFGLILAASLLVGTAMAEPACAQARSMDLEVRGEELTAADQTLRQLQQSQPLLFQQILNDINTDANVRDPSSVDGLASSSPALEDLNRSSPEALLGLFLLLKSAGKKDAKASP